MWSSELPAAARLESIKPGQLCSSPLHKWSLIGNREAGWQ
jgi:hypothetical protein